MKTIFLLRHAKSSWSDSTLDDYDRPLSGRGIKDAPRMGKYLRKIAYKPEYVVSSPAQRAKETAQLCVKAMKENPDMIKWDEDLYFDSSRKYIEAIQRTPVNVESMMIVGHNPLMESTASILSMGKENGAFRIPTAGLLCLESSALRWEDVKPGSCQLKWMMIPKVLKEIKGTLS